MEGEHGSARLSSHEEESEVPMNVDVKNKKRKKS